MKLQRLLADAQPRKAHESATRSPSRCTMCAVRARAICTAISPTMRDQYGQEGRTDTLRKGQTLVWEGEYLHLAAIVVAGVLKLSISLSDGREQIVGVVYPADFIGRPFGDRSQVSATALTDAQVCIFPQTAFDRLLFEQPDFGRRLLEHTLEELNRTRRGMLLLGRKSAPERIASFLLEISRRLGESQPQPQAALDSFELPLDRQQIADLLGLTIETVSRQLSAMRAAGLIRLPGRRTLEILDRRQLLELSGDHLENL